MHLLEKVKTWLTNLNRYYSYPDNLRKRLVRMDYDISRLNAKLDQLEKNRDRDRHIAKSAAGSILEFFLKMSETSELRNFFSETSRVCVVHRKQTMKFIHVVGSDHPSESLPITGISFDEAYKLIISGKLKHITLQYLEKDARLGEEIDVSKYVYGEAISPLLYLIMFYYTMKANDLDNNIFHKQSGPLPAESNAFDFSYTLSRIANEPQLIDYFAWGDALRRNVIAKSQGSDTTLDIKDYLPPPFDAPDCLREQVYPEPKRKSVMFLHNNYYHFDTLATALRARGWDAVTVSVESPDSPQRQFYFKENINLFHDDPAVRRQQTSAFFDTIPERFGALHFSGMGQASMFHEHYNHGSDMGHLPWDFLELRRHQTIVGYMPSGCLDGAKQSDISDISGGVCNRCIWQLRPDVCRDEKSARWASLLDHVCDWIGLEGDWAVGPRIGEKFVRGPVASAVDPDFWAPDLEVPEPFKIDRSPGELLVYHAVGNYDERRKAGRDIKGTAAVEAAIETLKMEGMKIKLFFSSKIPISDVRFYKVQADIVVDQLNYGRIGANARESFMMGRPTITRLTPNQAPPLADLRFVSEAPALNATEDTVLDVLRGLATDPAKRDEMSRQSRMFALDWYSAPACAKRYETVLDRLSEGLVPEFEGLYPENK